MTKLSKVKMPWQPPRVRDKLPKIHAVSIIGMTDGPGSTKSLITGVEQTMKATGCVNSASGRTAALAINYCERLGLDYSVKKTDGMYFVQRGGA